MCLKRSKKALTPECAAVVYHRQEEDKGDLRTDAPLLGSCSTEIPLFCATIQTGKGDLLNCLWESRRKSGFSAACRTSISSKMEQQTTDARLNYKIASSCDSDTASLCATAADAPQNSGATIACLKTNYEKLSSSSCRAAVRLTVRKHATNFFMDAKFSYKCKPDALLLCCGDEASECSDVTNGEHIMQVRDRERRAKRFSWRSRISD